MINTIVIQSLNINHWTLIIEFVLQSLAIKNFALIEDIKIHFSKGFTIITGETGSGKSILLDALALVLGRRADLSALRNPEEKCVVEAEFAIASYGLADFFQQEELDYEPLTIIRREILLRVSLVPLSTTVL